jgi:hypothetical protein
VLIMPRAIHSPLRLCDANRRWFLDGDGRGVLLTGFHTWTNLVDITRGDEGPSFDYGWYLDEISSLGHNYIRLWAWDALCSWDPRDRVHLFPWARTGPGLAVDGKPKLDLTVFDPEYFARLEERVALALERGIYVGVMLFEGWATSDSTTAPLDWHSFAGSNNINGIDVSGRLEHGWMIDWMALGDPAVVRLQEEYVRKVVRLLNAYPNVFYEVSNEAGAFSYAWQEHFVKVVKEEESVLPYQHVAGISGGMKTSGDDAYFQLEADWLAPEGWAPVDEVSPYRDGLALWGTPPETGKLPIILDTDHIWGIGGNVRWAWQSFLRGYHVSYMDKISDQEFTIFEHPWWSENTCLDLRRELGAIGRVAENLDLISMVPAEGDGWTLQGPRHCLSLAIDGGSVELDLGEGEWSGFWRETVSGVETPGPQGLSGRAAVPSPSEKDAVLILERLS